MKTKTNDELIAHYIKHGDPKCHECVRGMRTYYGQRSLTTLADKIDN